MPLNPYIGGGPCKSGLMPHSKQGNSHMGSLPRRSLHSFRGPRRAVGSDSHWAPVEGAGGHVVGHRHHGALTDEAADVQLRSTCDRGDKSRALV